MFQLTRISRILIPLTLILTTLLAACGSNQPQPTAGTGVATVTSSAPQPVASAAAKPSVRKPSGTLVVQQPTLRNLPMIPDFGGGGMAVYLSLMYDYLTILQRNEATGTYDVTPGLALKWEKSADLRTWTFHLKSGVRWHDGSEFTAEDVKYTVDNIAMNAKLVTPSSSTQTLKRIVESVETPDTYTLVFHLKSGYGALDSLLSDLWVEAPVSKKYLEKVGIDGANNKPIGTGPYKFSDFKEGDYLKLEALDDHWRQVPYYKTIIFKEVPEPSTAIAMLKTGDVDIVVAPITAKDEVVSAGFEARINPQTEYTFVTFSGLWDEQIYPKETDLKVPWRDIRVREAMNISIDREEIIKSLYRSQAQAAPVILFMPGTIGYNPDLKVYPYNPQRAKQLLAEAGYPNGFQFNMWIYPWTHAPEVPDLGQALAMYWNKIGISAKLTWSEWTNVVSAFSARKDPWLAVPRGSTRMAAPEVHLAASFGPKSRDGINAPDIWKLTQQMEAEGDLAKKDAIGRQAAAKIYEGYWMVPMAWSMMPYYVNPKKVGEWPFLKGQPYMMRLENLKHPGD